MNLGPLDFAGRSAWQRASGWTWAAGALAVTALAALLLQALPAWQRQQQLTDLRAQLARAQAQLAARPPAAPPLPAALEADALASARELAMPWGPLLGHLARHGSANIALTQLEPDARAGTLNINGQAASPETALAYARQLGQGTVLTQVQLLAHEPVPVPQRLGTQFRLAARWAPAAPGSEAAPAASAAASGVGP